MDVTRFVLPSSQYALGVSVSFVVMSGVSMYYILPLGCCIDWPAVKHSLAFIKLLMVFVSQTNIDHYTFHTRDKNQRTQSVTGKVIDLWSA